MVEVKVIEAKDTYFIRKEVLRKGIDLPFKFARDFEDSTFHLGFFFNEELMGIASFMKSDNNNFEKNQYQLRGMATLKKVRGKGAGIMLIDKAVKMLKEKGVNVLWCNAREVAVDFYKKQGFQVLGGSFNVDKIGEHYVMFVRLD